MVFAQTAPIYTEQCTTPSDFLEGILQHQTLHACMLNAMELIRFHFEKFEKHAST